MSKTFLEVHATESSKNQALLTSTNAMKRSSHDLHDIFESLSQRHSERAKETTKFSFATKNEEDEEEEAQRYQEDVAENEMRGLKSDEKQSLINENIVRYFYWAVEAKFILLLFFLFIFLCFIGFSSENSYCHK